MMSGAALVPSVISANGRWAVAGDTVHDSVLNGPFVLYRAARPV